MITNRKGAQLQKKSQVASFLPMANCREVKFCGELIQTHF